MSLVLKPDMVLDAGARLGEGPLWNPVDQRLDWVDIMAGQLHRFEPATGRDEVYDLGTPLGAFAPRRGGGYICAVESGFATFDLATGRVELVARVDNEDGKLRMNDGKCDPHGRFWAGTITYDATPGKSALYCLDPDLQLTKVLDAVTISNGLAWANDGGTFYFIDSMAHAVDAFDFSASDGAISRRRRLVDIPNDPSAPTGITVPDGMTIDAEGHLWVAVWGSGTVRRYSPTGELETVIDMPVSAPTSVAFAGEDLSDLYITTMITEVSHEPLAGALFRCRPGPKGTLPNLFAG